MSAGNPITVFIVEDSEVQRLALEYILSSLKDLHLVGHAYDGISAVRDILLCQPTVAVVDIGLPGLDGIEVTKKVKQALPNTCIVMLTAHEGDVEIFRAFAAGADGYVLKETYTDCFTKTLEMAIRTVHCGSVWLDPRIARRVLDSALALSEMDLKVNNQEPISFEPLTAQERRALDMVAHNYDAYGNCMVEPSFVKMLSRFSVAC